MNTRLEKISRTRYTWKNATENIEVTPRRYFYPESVEDLCLIVREAEKQNLRVRAVGSGHSFSEVAKGKDFLMDMKHLKGAAKYDINLVEIQNKEKHFVLADAGITIRRLNRKLHSWGLALSNMGAVDFQTISGALMTGTHGTGIKRPAIPDMVRALRIVGKYGEKMQIEPTDGITNMARHDQTSDLKLIKDDEIFYSALLSFGAMGIVFQLVMEVETSFWIRENRVLMSWKDLKKDLENGDFMKKVNEHDFVAFRVNPYNVKGEHLCSVVYQDALPDNASMVKKMQRNILGTIASNMEVLIEGTINLLNRKPQRSGKRIQTALKFSKVVNYTDRSFKVLYQSGAAVTRFGISSEFAFPAESQTIIKAVEHVFATNENLNKNAGLYQSSHISLRLVPPSEAYLSSAYHRSTLYVDIPILHTTIGDFEILEKYQVEMMKLGGIPHWGKINNMLYLNNQFIRDNYPKWDAWRKVRRSLDPNGTFLNDFIIEMGLE